MYTSICYKNEPNDENIFAMKKKLKNKNINRIIYSYCLFNKNPSPYKWPLDQIYALYTVFCRNVYSEKINKEKIA